VDQNPCLNFRELISIVKKDRVKLEDENKPEAKVESIPEKASEEKVEEVKEPEVIDKQVI